MQGPGLPPTTIVHTAVVARARPRASRSRPALAQTLHAAARARVLWKLTRGYGADEPVLPRYDCERMLWLPLSVMLAGLPVLLKAFGAFGRLVEVQRRNHSRAWRADGCPRTFHGLWPTPANWAAQRCSILWVWRTPDWVEGDAEAATHLRNLRRFTRLWIFGAMPIYVAALLLAVARS